MPEPSQLLPLAEPRLAIDGLVLRSWDVGDLPALVAAGVDPTVRRFRYSVPDTNTQAQAWLSKLNSDREAGRRVELAIAAATDLAAVGSVSLQDFEYGNATVRYWLAPTARGRGLATCAVRLLAGWGFQELALRVSGSRSNPTISPPSAWPSDADSCARAGCAPTSKAEKAVAWTS